MRARRIQFTRAVRTGPAAQDNRAEIDIDDEHFRLGVPGEEGFQVGTIDVYYGRGPDNDLAPGETGTRYVILRSPRIDRLTNLPFVNVIGIEHVGDVLPLDAETHRKLYGAHEIDAEVTADGHWKPLPHDGFPKGVNVSDVALDLTADMLTAPAPKRGPGRPRKVSE